MRLQMTNIADISSIGNFEVFVMDIEDALSLEVTLSSLTSWVEPTATKARGRMGGVRLF